MVVEERYSKYATSIRRAKLNYYYRKKEEENNYKFERVKCELCSRLISKPYIPRHNKHMHAQTNINQKTIS